MIFKKQASFFTCFLLIWSVCISPVFATELDAREISRIYYQAHTYEKSGNYDAAIKALQRIYNGYETSFGVNNRLGYLYGLNHQFNKSEFHYNQAISDLPDALSPKLGLMYTYLQAKRFEAVTSLGYKILRIDYYSYYGNFRLAQALRQIENIEMAEEILIKMLIRYPSDTLYLTELGLLALDKGEVNRANSIMQEVLILDPENITARSVLLTLEK